MKSIEQILQRDITYEGGSYPEPNEWKVSRENTGNIEEEIAKVEELYNEHKDLIYDVYDRIDYDTYHLLKDNIDELYNITIAAIKAKYE